MHKEIQTDSPVFFSRCFDLPEQFSLFRQIEHVIDFTQKKF